MWWKQIWAERHLTILDEKPSHIVVPAIHVTREEVGELFEREGISKEIGNYRPHLPHTMC